MQNENAPAAHTGTTVTGSGREEPRESIAAAPDVTPGRGAVRLRATREAHHRAREADGSDREGSGTVGRVGGSLERISGERRRGTRTEPLPRGGSHDVSRFEKR